MVEVAFLVLSALTLLGTVFAVAAPRRPAFLGWVAWVFGLIPSELPFAYLAWCALLVAVFGVLGAFEATLGIAALALLALVVAGEIVVARKSSAARGIVEAALQRELGPEYRAEIDPNLSAQFRAGLPLRAVLLEPFSSRRRDVTRVADLGYGDAGVRNLLDVYHHESRPPDSPVLVYIHGGAWTHGKKDQQGLPMIYHFASRGWVCVAPNYRLCPDATFPDPLVDIKRVIAWVRDHAVEYGGDPTRLFLSGGSAGGHLAALAALTANDPDFQPGFEHVNTSITAAIPLYGDYDWLDSNAERKRRGLDRTAYFVDRIVKCTPEENRRLWEQGSPLLQVRPDAPPFFVVHGDHDSLLLVEDTRHFVDALRAVSGQRVVYAELPWAQHAFDGFQSVRCGHVIDGIERFTAWVRTAPVGAGIDGEANPR
jgi:acetyl esterase/lipase